MNYPEVLNNMRHLSNLKKKEPFLFEALLYRVSFLAQFSKYGELNAIQSSDYRAAQTTDKVLSCPVQGTYLPLASVTFLLVFFPEVVAYSNLNRRLKFTFDSRPCELQSAVFIAFFIELATGK